MNVDMGETEKTKTGEMMDSCKSGMRKIKKRKEGGGRRGHKNVFVEFIPATIKQVVKPDSCCRNQKDR